MILPPLPETGRIVTLPALVAQLAAKTGEALAVAPELENEAIYLRGITLDVKTIPYLAKACAAEWVEKNSTLILERSGPFKARLARLESMLFKGAMKTQFKLPTRPMELETLRILGNELNAEAKDLREVTQAQDQLSVYEKLKPKYERFSELTNSSFPIERALRRLLSEMDVSPAIRLRPGEGMTFSNISGIALSPLPNAQTHLADFAIEWPKYRDWRITYENEVGREQAPGPCGNATRSSSELTELGVPTCIALDAFRGTEDELSFGLTFFDRSGQFISNASERMKWPELSPEGGIPHEKSWGQRSLPTNEGLKKAVRLLEGNENETLVADGAWSEDLLLDETRPGQKLDPLSAFVTPFLDALTQFTNAPLLINIPDGMVSGLERQKTVEDVDTSLRSHVAIVKQDGTLIGSPRLPLFTTSGRFVRRTTSELARLASERVVTLEEAVRYISGSGEQTILEGQIYRACPKAYMADADIRSALFSHYRIRRPWIKLLGQLTASQMSRLLDGQAIPIPTLSASARQTFSSVFYRSDVSFLMSPYVTPALAFPLGVPATVKLTGGGRASLGLLRSFKGTDDDCLGAESLGYDLYDQIVAKETPEDGVDLKEATFLPLSRTRLTLNFEINEEQVSAGEFEMARLVGSDSVSWQNLPPAYLREVHEGYRQAEENAKDNGK